MSTISNSLKNGKELQNLLSKLYKARLDYSNIANWLTLLPGTSTERSYKIIAKLALPTDDEIAHLRVLLANQSKKKENNPILSSIKAIFNRLFK